MKNTEFIPILPGRSDGPLMIAGPCSAESREQVLATAKALSGAGVDIFRAGVWKPRTKPGGFEGMGEKALPWLAETQAAVGIPVAVEVGNAEHVRLAFDAGIRILWIGARTTANPFAVQEIADAVSESGLDVAVLVKNPVNPDVELWDGAIQRLLNAGIRRLAAVHRGFSNYGRHIFRNPPQWSIPIELRRRYPRLPMLCDPSHIAGRRDLIPSLAQQALDMDFAGLMIEVHPDPQQALSDASQQLTPDAFSNLLNNLKVRKHPAAESGLDRLRNKIDECDHELLEILARRMKTSLEIGEYKQTHNLPVVQIERHDAIMQSRVRMGKMLGLSPDFTARLMSAIHEESVRRQLAVLRSTTSPSPDKEKP